MRYQRFVILGWLLLGMLATWPAQVRAQASGIKFEVTPLYGTTYRPGFWMPLRVQIANDSTDQTLKIRAGSFSMELEVPGGGRKEAIFYVFLERKASLIVDLYASSGVLATKRIELNPTSKPMVASLLTKVPARLSEYALVSVAPTALPQSSVGLDMLAAVLVDEQSWQALSPAQISALQDWIGLGGTLIVQGATTDQLPEALRPATSGPARQIEPLALARLVALTEEPVPFEALTLTPTAGSTMLAPQEQGSLVVQRPLGIGQIIAISMPLDTPELQAWQGYTALWSRLIPEPEPGLWSGSATRNDTRDSEVLAYLKNLPVLDLPPLRMLLLLLGLYVVLAGPINYLILRRLDRMALAWLTIPLLTVVFAVLAYGFGARQRGTDIIINELAIIDDYGVKGATVRGYVGVFSPVKAEYTLAAADETLVRPLSFINGWGGNQGGQTTRARFSNLPPRVEQLNVDQWSMSMFAYQQPLQQAVLPEISLTIEDNQVRGTVRNTSQVTLHDTALLIGGFVEKIGTLNPGAERAIEFKLRNTFSQLTASALLYQAEIDQANRENPETGPDRELNRKIMAINTALPSSSGALAATPFFIAFIEQSLTTVSIVDHRATHRQTAVLVTRPTVSYPNGRISLDSRWIKYETDQQDFNAPSTCTTSRGPGLELTSDRGEITMRLPIAAVELIPEQISLQPTLDGVIDASMLVYEMYNWETGAWDQVGYNAGVVDLPGAQPYLSAGQIRLKYSSPPDIENVGGWWGCLSPGPIVKGRLP